MPCGTGSAGTVTTLSHVASMDVQSSSEMFKYKFLNGRNMVAIEKKRLK